MIKEDVELKKLESHVKNILKKDFYKNRVVECCPVCGSKEIIKHGLYNGIQRYKCKKCDKTFSNTTNSLWSYSKKHPELWIKFFELMLEKKTLRFCAEKLNISLVTAFYWRHKILHAMTIDSTPNSLKGVIYVAKTIIPENFKGCRNNKIDNVIVRRRRIWIIGAKGDEDSMFVKPIFKDMWDLQVFHKKVYSKIEKKSYIVPYGDRYLSVIAKKHNKKRVLEVKDDNRIRYFMLNLKIWIDAYHGVATKYLERYLSFFVLFNLEKIFDYMNLMYSDLSFGNRFMKINKIRSVENYKY